MSDDENFLARWSRRKRDVTRHSRDQPKPEEAGGQAASEGATSLPPGEAEAPFDPASLPPIESLDAGSDIRAYLAAGVPAELARAALRRVWSADLTIRDFIGLSENSWDFNAPGGVPGFGTLTPAEIRRLVTQLLPEPEESAAAKTSTEEAAVPASVSDLAAHEPVQMQLAQESNTSAGSPDLTQCRKVNAAAQKESDDREHFPVLLHRTHGGALPK
jgi:hypothetical protein